jgi:hypothetical protein
MMDPDHYHQYSKQQAAAAAAAAEALQVKKFCKITNILAAVSSNDGES